MCRIFTTHNNNTSVTDSLLKSLDVVYPHGLLSNASHRLNNLLIPLLPMSTLQSLVYHIAILKGADFDQSRQSVQ